MSFLRVVVWVGVIAASVAVGVYVSRAPSGDNAVIPPKNPGSYIFVAGGSDPYWQHCIAGAKDAAAQLGANVEVFAPTDEGEKGLQTQLAWLNDVDSKTIDGVAVGPIDPTRTTILINRVAEDIPVVTVDSDVPDSRRLCYIGSSNYEAGNMAAQMIREALPNGGKVAVLLASRAKTNAVERLEGFEDELTGLSADDNDPASGATYEIVDIYMDQGEFDKCAENVRHACEQHDDLAAILGTFGYHGPIALETLVEIDGGEQIKLVTFDEDQRILDAIQSGRVHATIVQDPFMFGREAILMLERFRSGRYSTLPMARRVDVGVHCETITQANLEQFKSKLEERLKVAATNEETPVE